MCMIFMSSTGKCLFRPPEHVSLPGVQCSWFIHLSAVSVMTSRCYSQRLSPFSGNTGEVFGLLGGTVYSHTRRFLETDSIHLPLFLNNRVKLQPSTVTEDLVNLSNNYQRVPYMVPATVTICSSPELRLFAILASADVTGPCLLIFGPVFQPQVSH